MTKSTQNNNPQASNTVTRYYLSHQALGEREVTKEQYTEAWRVSDFRSARGLNTGTPGAFDDGQSGLRGRVSDNEPQVDVFDRKRIKRIFMARGFREQVQGDGELDLSPNLYEAAFTLLNSCRPKPERYWINQPSTLQPLHEYHAENVLAVPYTEGTHAVYFLKGDVISMVVHSIVLSPGWTVPRQEALTQGKDES